MMVFVQSWHRRKYENILHKSSTSLAFSYFNIYIRTYMYDCTHISRNILKPPMNIVEIIYSHFTWIDRIHLTMLTILAIINRFVHKVVTQLLWNSIFEMQHRVSALCILHNLGMCFFLFVWLRTSKVIWYQKTFETTSSMVSVGASCLVWDKATVVDG